MTTHSSTSNPLSARKLLGLLFAEQAPFAQAATHRGIFASLAGGFNAWRERRAAVAELNRLSDRELADIGVSRHEIPQVVARRF